MKKSIIILLLLPIVSMAQNLKKLDEKNGFKKYVFGSPAEKYSDLKEKEPNYYISITDTLSIGVYQLKSVYYGFYKNQLSTIIIKTKGYTNSKGVLSILEKAYGKGDQSNEYIEHYVWWGEKVTMSYDENSITSDATIFMYSKELTDLERKEKDQADKKATDGL